MGSGSTKILSYDEAVKRCRKITVRDFFTYVCMFCFCISVSQTDLERMESTFRDLTSGSNELSFQAFKRDVFANFLPEQLTSVCI